jgi:hypothetical protein
MRSSQTSDRQENFRMKSLTFKSAAVLVVISGG